MILLNAYGCFAYFNTPPIYNWGAKVQQKKHIRNIRVHFFWKSWNLYVPDSPILLPIKYVPTTHYSNTSVIIDRPITYWKILILEIPKKNCLFSCVYAFFVVPLCRIQCKGSRWDSCTVPLLWFAIRCSNSYKSLVLSELGRLNRRSDKSEDLLRATNEKLVKLNALGESSQRQWRKGFQ